MVAHMEFAGESPAVGTFAPPAVALAASLASPPKVSRVAWCLCRVDRDTNRPVVVGTCQAASRAEALTLLPPHPAHWFVTSRCALDTLGTIPVDFAQPRGGRVRRSA